MPKKPLLSYFSSKELDTILEEAYKTLEEVGLYLPNSKAKKIFKSAGAKEAQKDNILIPRQLIKEVLDSHNSKFKLYSQTAKDYLQLEIGNTFFGPGSDLQYTIDIETNEPRKTESRDVARNISIIDSLEQFDFLMSTGLPHEVDPEELYPEVFKLMVLNSDKPIVITATTLEDIEKIYEIGKQVAGSSASLREKPFFAAYLEPVSPLKMESNIADRIMFCAEKGIPYLFAAGANIAIEAPGTPEDAIIQGTAESLSGMVLGYLINPDNKFIFAANSADFDSNAGIVSYGGPGWSKTMAYYAEIARKLNLPTWGFGGSTDSNSIDAQAGAEAMFSLIFAQLSGATLVHDVGYLSHGDMGDPKAYLFNAEFIDRAKWMVNRGLIIPGEAIEVISDVKSGRLKSFLDAEHTFRNYKNNYHPQNWVDRGNYDEVEKSLLEKLQEETCKILEKNPEVLKGKIKTKREEEKAREKAEINIRTAKKKRTLAEIFQESANNPQELKAFLEEEIENGTPPNKLYSDLVNALSQSIEDTNLVFQLAYGRLFDKVADVVTSKMETKIEGTPLVLATVEGDMHYVGKTLVGQLAGMSGYKIIDKGIDAKTGETILSALDNEASLIGLSALLTTTRDNMKKTIKALKATGLKDQVGVIVGGAVIDKNYANSIGADAYEKSASNAGKALDDISEWFEGNYERKNSEEFMIIGESINSISNKIKRALETKDEKAIIEMVKKQVQGGAKYIDIAVSHLGELDRQKKAIQWAVRTIQKEFDTPLCLDSDDYRVIEAGFQAYRKSKGIPIINSATLEKKRLENMVRLASEYNSSIVFQAAEGPTLEVKLDMVNNFIQHASDKGIPISNIFVDPGLETTANNPTSAKIALQTISALKDKYPELNS
ncbi:MAG: trimethylamine methyltransferase family protein [Candidatus Woesearchaeota archaeon]